MNLINVTTWAARKRHLADADSRVPRLYGPGFKFLTLCNEDAVSDGDACTIGNMAQQRIDAMAPCKRCEKRRSAAKGVQP